MNPNTRRAYQTDVRDFMQFAGVREPQEFRIVPRSHLIAWRKLLESRNLAGANIRRKLSASVTIRITSDRFEGGISTVKVRFDNQCFEQNNAMLKEVVRVPEITNESDRKVLIIFQPMASLSAWLNMLTQAPQQSYYIVYGFEEHRAWAFAAPVGNREHPIGRCSNG